MIDPSTLCNSAEFFTELNATFYLRVRCTCWLDNSKRAIYGVPTVSSLNSGKVPLPGGTRTFIFSCPLQPHGATATRSLNRILKEIFALSLHLPPCWHKLDGDKTFSNALTRNHGAPLKWTIFSGCPERTLLTWNNFDLTARLTQKRKTKSRTKQARAMAMYAMRSIARSAPNQRWNKRVPFARFVMTGFHFSFVCVFCRAAIYIRRCFNFLRQQKSEPHSATICDEAKVAWDFQQVSVSPQVMTTKHLDSNSLGKSLRISREDNLTHGLSLLAGQQRILWTCDWRRGCWQYHCVQTCNDRCSRFPYVYFFIKISSLR